jgi:GPH family glycoside/pentoside/hexuronide:cation symporter
VLHYFETTVLKPSETVKQPEAGLLWFLAGGGMLGRMGLRIRDKLGFGIGDLGGNMVFTVMGFWALTYLTDTVGLPASLAGAAVMAGKAWDAVTDPVMGYLSDRTRTRWGRRRPYLLFGAVPLMGAFWLFFTGPLSAGGVRSPAALMLWAVFALILFNTCATVVAVPYSSLTPDLTGDYHERTSLNGYRFGAAVFGTIAGAAAVQPLVSRFPDKATGFSVMGFALGGVAALSALAAFFGTKEKPAPAPREGFFAAYRAVFANRAFLTLLGTYALHLMGITFLQSILHYYTKYLYGDEALTTKAMVVLLAVAMACIPVSVLVSKRIGKRRTYQICFVILGTSCAALFAFGHLLGPLFFLALMCYAGIGVGFSYVAPFAMVPDAIEREKGRENRSAGESREGAYYGIWTFAAKTGQALSVFLSGLLLSLGGYEADAVQSAASLLVIRIIIGPLPALLFAAAFLLNRPSPTASAWPPVASE